LSNRDRSQGYVLICRQGLVAQAKGGFQSCFIVDIEGSTLLGQTLLACRDRSDFGRQEMFDLRHDLEADEYP
jgi:hypothetical protein